MSKKHHPTNIEVLQSRNAQKAAHKAAQEAAAQQLQQPDDRGREIAETAQQLQQLRQHEAQLRGQHVNSHANTAVNFATALLRGYTPQELTAQLIDEIIEKSFLLSDVFHIQIAESSEAIGRKAKIPQELYDTIDEMTGRLQRLRQEDPEPPKAA